MTSDADSLRLVEDTSELLSLVHLTEMRVFEFSARATADATSDEAEPDVTMEYAEAHGADWLMDRFRFSVKTPDAEYLADVAPVYSVSEPVEVAVATRVDFAERVGFMTAFPFIRESIAASAARLGRHAPLMDLMRPGDFVIKANAAPLDERAGDPATQ